MILISDYKLPCRRKIKARMLCVSPGYFISTCNITLYSEYSALGVELQIRVICFQLETLFVEPQTVNTIVEICFAFCVDCTAVLQLELFGEQLVCVYLLGGYSTRVDFSAVDVCSVCRVAV